MISGSFLIGTSWREGAVSLQFRALGNELARRGHQVVILVDQRNKEAERLVGNPKVYTWPSMRPTHFRDARFLWGVFGHHRPTCLLSNFGSVNLMILIGWLYGVKNRIAWQHTLSLQIDQDNHLPTWRLALLRKRKRLIYRLATCVVGVSKGVLDDLQNVFGVAGHRCRVFYNSLTDPFPGRQIDKRLSQSPRLVCAARFHHSKGQDVLIRALARLHQDLPRVTVDFLGDGPTRPECENLAGKLGLAKACRFLGAVTHQQVLASMSQADLTVVPSRSEAFGLVALESLAVGTPVVASAVGGLPEVVQNGLQGRLVPAGDPAALAETLKAVLGDPTGYSRMSELARVRFVDVFEQRRAVQAQADWLESLL
jgi:glycosyltransferase involved in cell wall biosynthesis